MTTSTKKIIITLWLSLLSGLGGITFGSDPSFSLSIASGTQLKLHCTYTMGIMLNAWGMSYNGFDSTLKLDSGNVMISHMSINPFFTTSTTGYIKSGYLYRSYWVKPSWSSTASLQAATFGFKTTQNILSTLLEFTTLAGNTIMFDKNTTDDGAVINSSISSLDILTWITNATYTFIPLPCIVDNEAPTITNTIPTAWARYIAPWYQIGFLVYDWIGGGNVSWIAPLGTNNRSHYRYNGLPPTLENYQPAPTTVDNQEWVNSGTIKVTVTCSTCSWWWSYVLTQADLITTPWAWDGSKHRYTRDSADRWYTVSFSAPAQYEIEKLVTVMIQASDNPNENGTTHTGISSFSFNAPSTPVITRISPATSINVISNIDPIVFTMSDDRAGINPTTIQITIPAIMSGSTVLYTGYTYSGSDLTLVLTWGIEGAGNSWAYQVSFTPKRIFPSNTTVAITGIVYDYANNLWSYASSFTTKMSCSDWWCSDLFNLTILWGTNIGNYTFTWGLIIITWTNLSSPYPYFTWANNDILMCGRPYTGTILTGNIWIYDTTGTEINGILYTGDELYITGVDGVNFTYHNWVIIIQ